jgi:FKBP-type peptidyl-prolyl cis-trans isomerase
MKRSMVCLVCGVLMAWGNAATAQSPISVQDAVKQVEGQVDAANMPKDDAKPAATAAEGKQRTTPSGLVIVDLPGKEAVSANGDVAIVHYTGTLENGQKFDSSRDRGRPFPVTIGAGEVIKGWEEGLVGMKVGDRRQLRIPANLAYGAEEKRDENDKVIIPANSTLVFDIEMVGLVKTGQQQ